MKITHLVRPRRRLAAAFLLTGCAAALIGSFAIGAAAGHTFAQNSHAGAALLVVIARPVLPLRPSGEPLPVRGRLWI